MKYTTLKSDIANILHSPDYDLYLKFYDEDGNTTLNPNDAKWCYINNYNIMIEFMDDNNPNIIILKDNENFTEMFKKTLQQIRELAYLNGVSVQIRAYNDLNQRKLFNFIKNNIIQSKQEEQMNESLLYETLCNMIQVAKNTKRKSDFYLSEEMKMEISHALLSEMLNEVKSLSSLKGFKLDETIKDILSAKSFSDIKSIVSEINKNSSLSEKLNENINNIKNITSFVKNEYLNNVDFKQNKPKTLFILENAKVYLVKEQFDKENLINAYNTLVSKSQDIKSNTDLIRIIRNNNICETYNVSRNDLIDMWLSESNNVIKTKRAYVIEDSFGNKNIFNESLSFGIKALANYINNGGSRDDKICKNIISETIKYNEILSFLKEYHDSYAMKPYNLKLKKIFEDNMKKLNSEEFNTQLFENIECPYDYSNEQEQLIQEMNCEHPAIKYLAMESAKENALYARILIENNMNDLNVLQKNLKPYVKSLSELEHLVETIMKKEIKVNVVLTESKDSVIDDATRIYKELCFESDKCKSAIASSLFNIIHSKYRLDESKSKYVSALKKYIL